MTNAEATLKSSRIFFDYPGGEWNQLKSVTIDPVSSQALFYEIMATGGIGKMPIPEIKEFLTRMIGGGNVENALPLLTVVCLSVCVFFFAFVYVCALKKKIKIHERPPKGVGNLMLVVKVKKQMLCNIVIVLWVCKLKCTPSIGFIWSL